MSDLDTRLRRYYTRSAMSPQALARATEALKPAPGALDAERPRLIGAELLADRGAGDRRCRPAPRPLLQAGLRRPTALATLGVLSLALFLLLGALLGVLEERRHQAELRALAEEIAFNHNKRLAPEFEAGSMTALAQAMTMLDFTPVASARLQGTGLRVAGARYCAIAGNIAAQVRLRDREGQIATLYQLRPPASGSPAGEAVFEVDGVRVQLWAEAGLLMGLARAAR